MSVSVPSRVVRVALLAVTSVFLASALSGCASLLLLAPHGSALAGSGSSSGSGSDNGRSDSLLGAPEVGTCWSTDYDTAQSSADWAEGGPVPCTSAHELSTFAVAIVDSSASTWATSDGYLDDTIANAAYSACDDHFTEALPSDTGARVQEYFFIAPESEWRRGARWVRCDIALIALGSTVDSPTFAPLPSTITALADEAQNNPEVLDECVDTTDASGRSGPYDDAKARYTDCTGDYQWRFDTYFTVPGDDSASYPSDSAITKILQSECGADADAAGVNWIGYVPTTDQWDRGSRSGECWWSGTGGGAASDT